MDDLILRALVGGDREIWLSEVSRATFEANDPDDIGTDSGYFLMVGSCKPGGPGARILAKATSMYAALELFELLTSHDVSCITQAVETERSAECTISSIGDKPAQTHVLRQCART